MTFKRKLGIAAAALVATVTFVLWPRPRYTYQGKTVEEWFEVYLKEVPNPGSNLFASTVVRLRGPSTSEAAFKAMGTNAWPFLATAVNQRADKSWVDRARSMLPKSIRSMSRRKRAWACACLLQCSRTEPPRAMLTSLLSPSLARSNDFFVQLMLKPIHHLPSDSTSQYQQAVTTPPP